MGFLDLSENNTNRKAYDYELVEARQKLLGMTGKERQKQIVHIRYLKRKINECLDERGYKFGKKCNLGFGKKVISSKRAGLAIIDSTPAKTRYGAFYYRHTTRALTKEEHQEYLKQIKLKEEIK